MVCSQDAKENSCVVENNVSAPADRNLGREFSGVRIRASQPQGRRLNRKGLYLAVRPRFQSPGYRS